MKPVSNPVFVDLEQGCGNPVIEGHNPAGFSAKRVENLVLPALAKAVFCLGGQKTCQQLGFHFPAKEEIPMS